jgi:hypothetical protein
VVMPKRSRMSPDELAAILEDYEKTGNPAYKPAKDREVLGLKEVIEGLDEISRIC